MPTEESVVTLMPFQREKRGHGKHGSRKDCCGGKMRLSPHRLNLMRVPRMVRMEIVFLFRHSF